MNSFNFIRLLEEYANGKSQGKHIFLNPRKNVSKKVSHASLIRRSFGFSYQLSDAGINKGDICYIVSNNQETQLICFYAAIASGAIPMIGAQLPRFGAEDEVSNKIAYWKKLYGARLKVISENELKTNSIIIDNINSLPDALQPASRMNVKEDDILYLQSSSATTGSPKAISVSHKNIFTNIRQIKKGLDANDNETFVSWLPLYHDMGLVGAELFSLICDYDLILMPPYEFTRNPEIWLETIFSYKGTITAIPSFATDYVIDRIETVSDVKLDLSSLHSVCIGAEPIRMDSLEKFYNFYSRYGLKKNALVPCYGLAESTLAATFKPSRTLPKSLLVLQNSIKRGEKVELTSNDSNNAIRITSVGELVENLRCDIVHNNKVIKNDLICGEIYLRGPSITQGYMHDPGFISLLPNNTLSTGDIGFMYKEEIYILDRDKNIIIMNGVNYIASEIETFVAELLCVEKRNVIVFENQINIKEKKIIAVVEVRNNYQPGDDIKKLIEKICTSSIVNEIHFISRGFIEMTSSGKKQYFLARKKFEIGEFNIVNICSRSM